MTKKSMLFVTKLHFDKNGNGGQQRTYFLIKELSHHYNLFVISPYTAEDNIDIEAEFILNTSVFYRKAFRKNKVINLVYKTLNFLFSTNEKKKSVHQSNFEYYVLRRQLHKFKEQKKHQQVETIVFDTLSSAVDLKPSLYKHRILNAHNFDSELNEMNLELKSKELVVDKQALKNIKYHLAILKRYEHNIDAYFTEIWVCSKADEYKFKAANPTSGMMFYELPNGSDPDLRQFQPMKTDNYKKFLFVGSLNYFPNVNGISWFIDDIFKKLPSSFELNIVGKSPNPDDFKYLEQYSNINLIGEVEDVEPFYAEHDVIIVPLLEGSGTRLKILEALSYGKLVLSTEKGIEGIHAKNGLDYIEFSDFESFKTNILDQLDDEHKLESIRKNGRQLIEGSYSWKKIVKNYNKLKYA